MNRNVHAYFMSEKKKNVAWVSGAYYLCKSVLDKIKEKVKTSDIFICDSTTEFAYLLNSLTTNQCFSSNRFVLVQGLPAMTESEKKKLKAIIENLSEDILLVFCMIDPSEEKAIFNSVEKVGKIFHFDQYVAFADARSWLDKRISELQIDLEEKAKEAIIENCGYNDKREINTDILNSSLIKLILNSPGKKIYEISDVVITSSYYDSFIVWDLLNACDEKDYDKCLNIFSKCVLSSKNSIEAMNKVINTLLWKYRLLIFLKEKIANKADTQLINSMASSIRKISYNGTGFNAKTRIDSVQTGENKGSPVCTWNSGIVFKAMSGQYGRKSSVELYSRKELYVIVKCLENCLILTRSCTSESEAMLIADIIFMTISSFVDEKIPKALQESLMNLRV